MGPHAPSLGGPAPTRRRVGQFLKSLVGRNKSSSASTKETTVTTTTTIPPQLQQQQQQPISQPFISRTGTLTDFKDHHKLESDYSLNNLEQQQQQSRLKYSNSTTSLNIVNQKLWSVVPLLRKESSCSSLLTTPTNSASRNGVAGGVGGCGCGAGCNGDGGGGPMHQHHHHHHHQPSNQSQSQKILNTTSKGLRKCNTVITLTQSSSINIEPIKPLNRLRNYSSIGTCSRCSSLLSLAGSSSKYSLNTSNGGFITVNDGDEGDDDDDDGDKQLIPAATKSLEKLDEIPTFACKLCLGEIKLDNSTKISQCGCLFCSEVSPIFFIICYCNGKNGIFLYIEDNAMTRLIIGRTTVEFTCKVS